MADSIMVETDLFEHREVGPDFINPSCFGEDFAAWLKQQLPTRTESDFAFSEDIQEDYGWGFWALRGKHRFWIALSYVYRPQEAPAQWVISVTYDPGFNLLKRLFLQPDLKSLDRLRTSLAQVLSANPDIRVIQAS